MNWEEELTEEQISKIKDMKDPTITEIINIADILDIDPITIFKYFQENNESQ